VTTKPKYERPGDQDFKAVLTNQQIELKRAIADIEQKLFDKTIVARQAYEQSKDRVTREAYAQALQEHLAFALRRELPKEAAKAQVAR
jgi:hypothetical protein